MDLSNAMKTARALQEAMRRDSPPPEEGAPSADGSGGVHVASA